jgi:arylsulfatase A-like enzyme
MKSITLLKTTMLLLYGTALQASALEKPNILFIMSDDHTSQAIGAYGGRLAPLNPTPNLDRLASEGVVMENAFCHNAICTPSRACIMTGQYSAVNGVTTLNMTLPSEKQYLPAEMKKAGYLTAVIGKWHLGRKAPSDSFDYYKIFKGQGKYFDTVFDFVKGIDGPVKEKGHSTDLITDSVLAWLKQRDKTKPFFLKYHMKAPHGMFENAPRYDSYLEDVTIPEPANLFEKGNHGSIATRGNNGELENYIGSSIGPRHVSQNYMTKWSKKDHLSDVEATKVAYQDYMKHYLRCVKGVDDNVQRVVDYLKEEGCYDNTVIIYTGDQGFFLGEHDYIDKRWCYDEAMRMPFIVRYPKTIKAGSRSDAIVENVDYAPLMLDFAGVPTPDYMQGKSFRSIIETGKEPADWKQAAYYHYWMHMKHHYNPAHIAIRTKRYKLILFYGTWKDSDTPDTPPAWELYDLKNDPHEMNNLYDNPEYTGVTTELKQQLKELRAQTKDDHPSIPFNKVIDDFWDYDNEDRARAEHISHEAAERLKSEMTSGKKKTKKGEK